MANFVAIYYVIFRQIIWFETFFFEKSILTLKFKHRDLINEIEISLWKISINWPFKYILSIFFSSQFHTNSPGDKFLCLTNTPRPHTILSSFATLDPLLIQQTSWTGQYECSLIFAVHKKGRVSDHSSFGTAATYLLAAHRIVRRHSTTDQLIDRPGHSQTGFSCPHPFNVQFVQSPVFSWKRVSLNWTFITARFSGPDSLIIVDYSSTLIYRLGHDLGMFQ